MQIVELLLAYAGPTIVGLVFVVTGFLKLAEPMPFGMHLQKLELVPPKYFARVLTFAIVQELVLGVALLIGCAPMLVIPLAILTIATFTIITLRAGAAGRITDCGCYQGLIELTPKQSALVNLGYMLALAAALPFRLHLGHWVTGLIVAAAAIAATLLARESLKRSAQMRDPLIDLNGVKAGKRFDPRWTPGCPVDLGEGERLVVFLGLGCSACKPWLPVLRALNASNQGMPVIGVLAGDASAVIAFVAEYQVDLPLVVIPHGRFNRLVRGTPIAAHLVDGRIEHRYVGVLPRDVALRARNRPKPSVSVESTEAIGVAG
ncbi:MAG: hypothetical protein RMA76_05330 [Deltaproteobacteria bacterium]|jgi:uncharacterized membrane protein YphA (DoxX/SURF4 family)